MKPSTIYLIRKRALGDVLWIEPLIRELSKQYKKVIVYTKFQVLFENYPEPNVVFKENLNLFEKMLITVEHFFHISLFTINLDMSYEKDPLKHVLAAYFNAARLPLKRYYPKLYLSDKEKNSINRQKPFAIIHLKASSAAKNFRNAFGINWDSVIEHLENTGFDIVEIGDAPGLIPQYYQSTSIREMIALMSKASLFIGIDSGPSHIAASLEIPSIVFFGAVNPEFRHFKDQFKGIILQQFCEYAGCYHTNPIAYKSHSCRLVGDSGIPKCCNFTTIQVVETINELVAKYNIKHA